MLEPLLHGSLCLTSTSLRESRFIHLDTPKHGHSGSALDCVRGIGHYLAPYRCRYRPAAKVFLGERQTNMPETHVFSQHQTTFIQHPSSVGASLSVEDLVLEVTTGPHQGTVLTLDKEYIKIGRADWCDLILSKDGEVSKEHCEVWLDEKGVRIRDTESRNGTKIAGCQIYDALLSPSATFEVGQSAIKLTLKQQDRREIAVNYSDPTGLLVGKHPKMRKLFSVIEKLSQRDIPVLLTGETGVGKTSVARAIHNQSKRANGPFVEVNCGALPAGLIESEFFGYAKGAFTGADKDRKGLFEQANGGTLFLDEIGELPLDLQPKLLSALEEGKLRPLGGEKSISFDVRLLTATHKALPDEIAEKRFRKDLYFRLAVVVLEVPPLRERVEDIPLLAELLLRVLIPDSKVELSKDAIQKLQRSLWPGNVRQLRNTLDASLLFWEQGTPLQAKDIQLATLDELGTTTPLNHTPPPPTQAEHSITPPLPPLYERDIKLKEVLADIEKAIIAHTLEVTGGSVSAAAEKLDLSLGWLYNRINKHGLKEKKSREGS